MILELISRSILNLILNIKLGRRPSFETTSPLPLHPSTETIIITSSLLFSDTAHVGGPILVPHVPCGAMWWFLCLMHQPLLADSNSSGRQCIPGSTASPSRIELPPCIPQWHPILKRGVCKRAPILINWQNWPACKFWVLTSSYIPVPLFWWDICDK